MHTLMLFQTATRSSHSHAQILLINVIRRTQEMEFRFQDYRRTCPASEFFETLLFILSNRLKWISGQSFADE